MVTVYADLAIHQAPNGQIAAGVSLSHRTPEGYVDYCVISRVYSATMADGKPRSIKQTLPTLVSEIVRHSGPLTQEAVIRHNLIHLLQRRTTLDNAVTNGIHVHLVYAPGAKMTYARLLLTDAIRRGDTVIQPVGGYNI